MDITELNNGLVFFGTSEVQFAMATATACHGRDASLSLDHMERRCVPGTTDKQQAILTHAFTCKRSDHAPCGQVRQVSLIYERHYQRPRCTLQFRDKCFGEAQRTDATASQQLKGKRLTSRSAHRHLDEHATDLMHAETRASLGMLQSTRRTHRNKHIL